MINEIYIPDGFEYVYSPLIKKMVLKPKQGFSDNYLQDNQFVPLHECNLDNEENDSNEPQKKTNKNLHKAKKIKNDEFYTTLGSIVNEVKHYQDQFKDKIVYCPCDKVFNKGRSNFFEYFSTMFHVLGLKKLICTQYNPDSNGKAIIFQGRGIRWDYNGEIDDNIHIDECGVETTILKGNGSFDSEECQEIMSQCDIVVTNPPFSLLRSFIAQIIKHNKQFLIIGPQNAITCKEIFPLIQENKMWLGYTYVKEFEVPITEITSKTQYYDETTGKFYQKFGNICWYTNLMHNKRTEMIPLVKKYEENAYLIYDNYNAINVDKVENIPYDYNGILGVPITFLTKYNPNQFQIIGLDRYVEGNKYPNKRMFINGKEQYARILIKIK